MTLMKKKPGYDNERLELSVSFVVSVTCIIYALWTISLQISTFFRIPWAVLSKNFILSLIIIIPISIFFSIKFSRYYLAYLDKLPLQVNIPSGKIVAIIVAASVIILAIENYKIKFLLIAISFMAMIYLQLGVIDGPAHKKISREKSSSFKYGYLIFILLVSCAVTINLVTYRSDFDDSHFIQLAAQTLLHPELPPLTFDTTLGYVYDHFRFAPYRIASYETFIALISQYSRINLLDVYYLVIPAVTSGLTLCVAFLFSRIFVDTNKALISCALFLLIMLAWGDIHVAYGNRVFVRLFQGKGLLIALTTPLTIIAGLLLIHKPTLAKIVPLFIAHIITLGVSSSGLVLTVFTSSLILFCAISPDIRLTFKKFFYVGLTLIYPAIFVVWLKFFNQSGVPLAEVGTYLPVDSSLGLSLRSSLTLIIMLFGFALTYQRIKTSAYPILLLTTFIFILNPWFADFIARFSSLNMSWRLAWAAPVPLLISLGLTIAITQLPRPLFGGRKAALALGMTGCLLFMVFLCGARWAIATTNDVTWGKPSIKVPPEYHITANIVTQLGKVRLPGAILATSPIAAWIPLLKPGTSLVMPGHTYPVMLQTILPAAEFAGRMRLFAAINSPVPSLSTLYRDMQDYHVGILILNAAIKPEDIIKNNAENSSRMAIELVAIIEGYAIYQVKYDNQ